MKVTLTLVISLLTAIIIHAQTLPPTANPATALTATSFTANCTAVSGAIGYLLDVSTNSSFSTFVSGYQYAFFSTTSQLVTGLSPGTYYYRVRATGSSFGNTAYSNTITVSLLPPPIPLVSAGTAMTTSSFTANWSAAAGATGYQLDISTVNTFSSFVTGFNNLSVTGISKSITGLTAGTTYYYRLRSVNSVGVSGNSAIITVALTPGAPVTTAASSITSSSFVANWGSSLGASAYLLDVSSNSGFTSFLTGYNNRVVTGTNGSVTGLSAGATYYYRVRATNTSGTSVYSSTITTLLTTVAPTALAATALTTNSFTANWGSVSGASSYQLDVSTDNAFSTLVTGYNNLSVTGTSKSVTGLASGTPHYYRLRSVNASGASTNSVTITATTTGAPPAPVAGVATGIFSTAFTATWSSVAGANSYQLDVSISASFSSFVSGYNNLAVNTASQNVIGLTAGTTYYYRVRTVDANGTSANSNAASVLTTPAGPVAASATAITSSSFTANWSSSPSATGYQLDVSTSSDFSTFVTGYNNLVVATTSAVVSGLTTKTTYYYRVRAVNSSGASGNSGVMLAVNLDYSYVRSVEVEVAGKMTLTDVENAGLTERKTQYTFIDGLGRPIQSVTMRWSPLQKDMVQPIVYDQYGREPVKYLPFVTGDDGWYKLDFVPRDNANYTALSSPQYQFYQTALKVSVDTKPYAETILESSPLNRPDKNYGAGVAWRPVMEGGQDKFIQHQYMINQHGTSTTQEKIIAWTLDGTGMPIRGPVTTGSIETGGYYSTSQLMVKGTVDEQGNTVYEYTNKEDQVVLKKVQVVANSTNLNSTTDWALTYYIYDDFGNLRFVLTPELSKLVHQDNTDVKVPNATDLANWAFQYTYDARNRMITKQIPGAGPVYMVYDRRDRLVLTQDANQRANKYWSFTKYDMLNRPVLTGIYQADSVLLQSKMQRRVNTFYAAIPGNGGAWFESYTGATTVHGYDNKSYPQETNADNYLSVTYYDNYTFRNNWPSTYKYTNDGLTTTVSTITYNQFATENQQVVGQVTGSKIKVLDGGVHGGYTWLRSVNYYDDKYRIIQTQTDNYKGGKDKISNLYDFVGKTLVSKETHTVTTWTDLVGVKQDGNKIIRTASGSGWGTSGAASVQQLGAGQDGWVEFVASELVDYRLLGLSAINADAGYTSIDYAWDLAPGNIAYIFEKGTNRGQFSYSLGDVFRIERVGTTISYYQNNVFRFSSTVPSSSSLIVDMTLYSLNAELANIRTSFTNAARTITRTFDYDHTGRLLRTWHQVDDNGTNYLLSKNDYNELGQLVDKKLHSVQLDASDNKQSVDYRYNIRGWLTSINNSQLKDDHTTTNTNDDTSDLFGMNLLYNTDDANLGNTGLFNGNISGMRWNVGLGQGNTKELGYNFSYDAMNRLTAANSRMNKTTWQAGYYDETVPLYDLNGNIKNLTRKGDNNLQIDNLTYYYSTNGNQLQYVQDNTSSTTDKLKGFIDGNAGTAIDYTYDTNGNLTHDLNKGIGITTADATNLITYNFLNLPETVTKAGNNIRYIYDASGRKLAQVVSFVNTRKQTDYVGEFQYENDVLQFINHEEGRIAMSGTKLIYSNSFTALSADITTTASATAATYSNNGENYIKVTTSTASNGLSQIGNASTYTVQPGDRYRIRLKGYRTTNPAYLQITAGSTILNSPGTALPNSTVTESWIEQIVTIPSGVTTMKVGVIWGTTVATNESLYVNELEVSQLNIQAPEYQYNLKDHLGNVRLTFTTQPTVDVSLATFEDAYADAKVFKNVSTSTTYWVSKSGANNTSPGQYVMRMNNTYPAGPSKTLQVFPGDVINAEVWSYFEGTSGFGASNQTNPNLILAVAAAFGGVPGGAGESGSIYNGVNSAYTTHGAPSNQGDGNPTAHLNYILFDKNYNYIDMGFQPIPSTANMTKQKIAFAPIAIKEVGYIYVYLSYSGDGTNWVYFDDFKITNTKSPVIASNDYYPFGLTFNSYSRENSLANQYKFNGIEEQDELGLNVNQAFFRTMDPAIGRWWQIDPKLDYSWSPYAAMDDNPILYSDPLGDTVDPTRTKGMNFIIVADKDLRRKDREEQKSHMKGAFRGVRAFFTSAYTMDNLKARSMQALSLGKLKVISAGSPKEAADKMISKMGSKGYVANLTIDYHSGKFGNASLSGQESKDAFKSLQNGYAGYKTNVLLGQCWGGGNSDLNYPHADETNNISKALDGATVYGNQAAASSIGFIFRNTFTGPVYTSYGKTSGNLSHYGMYSKTDVLTPTPITIQNNVRVSNSGEIEE